jgi:hypothetical protein
MHSPQYNPNGHVADREDYLPDMRLKLSARNVSISAIIIYMLFCFSYLGSGIYFTFQRGSLDMMGIGLGIVFGAVSVLMFFRYKKIGLEI